MTADVTSDAALPLLARPFFDKLLCIHVTRDAPPFRLLTSPSSCAATPMGRIVQKVGALWIDEAYWDIQVGPHVLVLHYQHYLGVFLCAGSPEGGVEVERLLAAVREYVAPAP